MSAIFEFRHTVRDEEMDGQGHVNNLAYMSWMQSAAVAHSTAQGWPATRYRESNTGWVARKHTIEYLQPAFAGEEIVVRTWVAGFRKVTSLRKYKIVRIADDAVLAVAETNWAFINLERHLPRRIPPEMKSAFEVVPAESEP